MTTPPGAQPERVLSDSGVGLGAVFVIEVIAIDGHKTELASSRMLRRSVNHAWWADPLARRRGPRHAQLRRGAKREPTVERPHVSELLDARVPLVLHRSPLLSHEKGARRKSLGDQADSQDA